MMLTTVITNMIPVMDCRGTEVDRIILPEKIRPAIRRRGGFAESGIYYKGAGIIYSGHTANELMPGMIRTGDIQSHYQRYHVLYPALYGKFGIFTFPHQPIFTDFEGGCGSKEENLVWMQKRFRYSAINGDIEVLPTPIPGHNIYVYQLRELRGGYWDCLRLLEYVLTEHFNCPWDKNIWGDLYCYGYVRDLADWFVSEEPCHKLGTVYAFLQSILSADKYLYSYLIRNLLGCEAREPVFLPYLAARIVKRLCPSCLTEYDLDEFTPELYGSLLRELYMGKACCHLEDEAFGKGVREALVKEIDNKVRAMEQILRYILDPLR